MTPDMVFDVGNTRTKCGFRARDGSLALAHLAPSVFNFDFFPPKSARGIPVTCVVSGSQPQRRDELVRWLRSEGAKVVEITTYEHLPIRVDVEASEKVGIDRLLGAVAANRLRTPGRAAITVDVGTATTVNLVTADGAFVGGLILPGVRLMAAALHANTAALPEVTDIDALDLPRFPGRSTDAAIRAGVAYAIAGAVRLALDHATVEGVAPQLFLTGGGANAIARLLDSLHPRHVPTLVLDGLFITAETLP